MLSIKSRSKAIKKDDPTLYKKARAIRDAERDFQNRLENQCNQVQPGICGRACIMA